jgi:predicted enzyme related to lactoylglutathione lyase
LCVGRLAGTVGAMEMKLELVPVPVSDIDRAKAFYGNSWTLQEMSWRTGDRF